MPLQSLFSIIMGFYGGRQRTHIFIECYERVEEVPNPSAPAVTIRLQCLPDLAQRHHPLHALQFALQPTLLLLELRPPRPMMYHEFPLLTPQVVSLEQMVLDLHKH